MVYSVLVFFCYKLDDSYNLRTFIIYLKYPRVGGEIRLVQFENGKQLLFWQFHWTRTFYCYARFPIHFEMEFKSTNQIGEWMGTYRKKEIYVYVFKMRSEACAQWKWIEWRALDMKLVQFLFVIEFDLLAFGIFFLSFPLSPVWIFNWKLVSDAFFIHFYCGRYECALLRAIPNSK